MLQQEFKDLHIKDVLVRRNTDKSGEKFLWPDIHHMHFHKVVLGMFFMEKSYEDKRFWLVNIAKWGMTVRDLQNHNLKNLYNSALKISGEKYNDLHVFLKKYPPL